MTEQERRLWEALTGEVSRIRDDVRARPVSSPVSPDEIRRELRERWSFDEARDGAAAIREISRLLERWTVHVTHPRYFGLFNPSVTLPSIAADALVAAWNPQLAAWSHAPAANEIEQHTIGLFLSKLGWTGDGAFGNFCTGGAEANLTATLCALVSRLDGFVEKGTRLEGARPAIYVSSEAHHSFGKIAVMTGLGRESIRTVPVDATYRLDIAALRHQLSEDRGSGFRPVLIVATAGTTSGGIVDDLGAAADVARESDAWFHVDAAWGGGALLSPDLKAALHGIDEADSVTIDAHKWLSVPMGAGMFLTRSKSTAVEAFGISTAYMPSGQEGAIDPYLSTVQWTRRFIGLKLFLSLAVLGEPGYRSMVEEQAAMGNYLRSELRSRGWRILNDTPLPVVCFTLDSARSRGLASIASAIQDEGDVWISRTVLGGRDEVLRACITSYQTRRDDVDRLVAALERFVP